MSLKPLSSRPDLHIHYQTNLAPIGDNNALQDVDRLAASIGDKERVAIKELPFFRASHNLFKGGARFLEHVLIV